MKISTKLILLFIGILIIFAGLAITLLGELKFVSASYNALLQGPVRQAEAARVAQVDLKKQVQEWKDILLRGQNPEDLIKYTKQFHEREAEVKAEAAALSAAVEDPKTRLVLEEFQTADATLSAKYQAAYDAYIAGNFDFKAADVLVRGQDRAPTDLFDTAVAQLNERVTSMVSTQEADAARQRNIALGVAVTLLVGVSLAGFMVLRGILSRLRRLKAVSDRLAVADVGGLVIDISGNDEIGEFGESMKGVAAAIEELSSIAASRAA